MSDEEPELPVAAYEWRYVDWEDGHTVLRHDEPDRDSFDVELELVDELVRKSNAEEAIQEREEQVRQEILNKIEQRIEYKKFQRARGNYPPKTDYEEGRLKQLEEFREELEGDTE